MEFVSRRQVLRHVDKPAQENPMS